MHDASTSSPDVPEHGFFRSSDGWMSCCNASFYLPDLQDSRTIKCEMCSNILHLPPCIHSIACRSCQASCRSLHLSFFTIEINQRTVVLAVQENIECGIQGVAAWSREIHRVHCKCSQEMDSNPQVKIGPMPAIPVDGMTLFDQHSCLDFVLSPSKINKKISQIRKRFTLLYIYIKIDK